MTQSDNRSKIIYTFLERYIDEKGYPPSVRDISTNCDVPKSMVLYHLERLEGEGCITRQPYRARSIRLVSEPQALDDETMLVLNYLKSELATGICPSQQEIAEDCAVSRWVVQKALAKLEARGVLRRGSGQRNISLHSA